MLGHFKKSASILTDRETKMVGNNHDRPLFATLQQYSIHGHCNSIPYFIEQIKAPIFLEAVLAIEIM